MSEKEKNEESMRMGKGRKSPGKTDVPKLYTYNECELSVKIKSMFPKNEKYDLELKIMPETPNPRLVFHPPKLGCLSPKAPQCPEKTKPKGL